MLNISQIKKDFPVLHRKIRGKPISYLDSAASSLKPRQVILAQDEYYKKFGVNIFRGIYKLSQEATAKYEEARKLVADFFGVADEKEIVFARNATEAINLVAYCWGRAAVDSDTTLVSTVTEHHANLVTWQQLAKERGATIKYLDIDDNGYLKASAGDLEKVVNKSTKMIALTHASNVLGTINPLKEIISQVKKINPSCLVLIDGAQAVPHFKVNILDLGCDFYCFSGHKMLGPTGIGVLWGRYELLERMPPFQFGGDMIKEVYLDRTIFEEPPTKYEAGTPNIAGAIGLGAAVNYLSKLGMDNVREHEKSLTAYAHKQLQSIEDLTIYGPEKIEDRGGVLAFNVKGLHVHDLAQVLDEENVCIRAGHHCAMPLHTRLGIASSARASFYIYNNEEDVDKLVAAIEKAKKVFK
jgi:cysteine desulfurase/selenocysteine lyase